MFYSAALHQQQCVMSKVLWFRCWCVVLQGFDEVRRLGLRQETEVVVRAAKARSHGAPGVWQHSPQIVCLLSLRTSILCFLL